MFLEYIYPVIFAIFPALVLYEKNFYSTDIKAVLHAVMKTLLVLTCLIILLSCYGLDSNKISLFILLLIIAFYSSGKFYILRFNQISKNTLINKTLFIITCILYTLLTYFLITQLPFSLKTLTSILNIIAIFALIITLTEISKKLKIEESFKRNANPIPLKNHSNKNLPDIYHIVLDAYAGFNTLEKEYNFKNQEFESFLIDKGFKVLKKAKSNYRQTIPSIPSMFNMEYKENIINNDLKLSEASKLGFLLSTLFNNKLFDYLVSYNYNLVLFISETYLKSLKNIKYNKEVLSKVPNKLTSKITIIKSHVERLLFARCLYFLSFPVIWIPEYYRNSFAKHILKIYSDLEKTTLIKSSPKYVFSHILSPHRPYLFDNEGNVLTKSSNKTSYEQYMDQLIFITERTKESVEKIMSKMDKNSIIIIHSDHSPFGNTQKEFDILFAIYLPDNENILPEDLSLVNLYRYILNKYFGEDLEILESKFF